MTCSQDNLNIDVVCTSVIVGLSSAIHTKHLLSYALFEAARVKIFSLYSYLFIIDCHQGLWEKYWSVVNEWAHKIHKLIFNIVFNTLENRHNKSPGEYAPQVLGWTSLELGFVWKQVMTDTNHFIPTLPRRSPPVNHTHLVFLLPNLDKAGKPEEHALKKVCMAYLNKLQYNISRGRNQCLWKCFTSDKSAWKSTPGWMLGLTQERCHSV